MTLDLPCRKQQEMHVVVLGFLKRNHGRISMCKLFVTDIDTCMYNNNKNLQVIGDKHDV